MAWSASGLHSYPPVVAGKLDPPQYSKPWGKIFEQFGVFTLLGNGEVVLVLDVSGLVEQIVQQQARSTSQLQPLRCSLAISIFRDTQDDMAQRSGKTPAYS